MAMQLGKRQGRNSAVGGGGMKNRKDGTDGRGKLSSVEFSPEVLNRTAGEAIYDPRGERVKCLITRDCRRIWISALWQKSTTRWEPGVARHAVGPRTRVGRRARQTRPWASHPRGRACWPQHTCPSVFLDHRSNGEPPSEPTRRRPHADDDVPKSRTAESSGSATWQSLRPRV